MIPVKACFTKGYLLFVCPSGFLGSLFSKGLFVGMAFLLTCSFISNACDLADRLDPDVPGPLLGPLNQDGNGWADIDQLGAWECALNPFTTMLSIPGPLESKWGRVVAAVLRSILNAPDEESLTRALKWFLILPQAFLRQTKRGGQAGRSSVAGWFNAAMEDDYSMILHLLMIDRQKEKERRERMRGKPKKQRMRR